MIRVWFNHWFSTSYRLIELMKEDKEQKIYIIASNLIKESIIQNVCDEWYEEPRLDGEDYIEYCLKFCREHSVQVFVPRRNMLDISKNIEAFRDIGVRVMIDSYDKISLLNDKAAAYQLFRTCADIYVPEYYMVNSADDFVSAYQCLKEKSEIVCMKFVQDEGGMSFRRIAEEINPLQKLRRYPGFEIPYQELKDILSMQGHFDQLMLMPYLSGQEISVDCLNTPDGLIAVPRFKSTSRHEVIKYDSRILKMAETIMQKVQLEQPCNIQFKMHNGIPYLLEVNTRMSGGLQMSCLASGVNIPNIALNQLLGKRVHWMLRQDEKLVSYIELPEMIENLRQD